ncbi:MAG: hypothetical protein ACRD0K_25160 [Egibacteraceae bacterium]
MFGFADDSVQETVQTIAPIVAIDRIKDPTVVIGRFEELAGSLGADPDAPALVAARQRFDEAVVGADGRRSRTSLACSPSPFMPLQPRGSTSPGRRASRACGSSSRRGWSWSWRETLETSTRIS